MLDVLGYAASVVVILSLMMSSILWLRILNLTGTALWSFYGAAIGAMPILVVNVILVGVNFYYLVRMVAKKESFHLLEVDADSTYLRHFVERSAADIRRFAPNFDATPRPDQITLFVLRDLSPVGLFIGDPEPGGASGFAWTTCCPSSVTSRLADTSSSRSQIASRISASSDC